MARLRLNFIEGILAQEVDSNDIILTSTQLIDSPVINAGDYITVVLDPALRYGNPEIVYLTEHAASSNTATIIRAREGTTARTHPVGVMWAHTATAADFQVSGDVVEQDALTLYWMEP